VSISYFGRRVWALILVGMACGAGVVCLCFGAVLGVPACTIDSSGKTGAEPIIGKAKQGKAMTTRQETLSSYNKYGMPMRSGGICEWEHTCRVHGIKNVTKIVLGNPSEASRSG
jgi:hypothetical protein